MPVIRRLDFTGDTQINFDLENPETLTKARALWDSIIEKGGAAFRTQPGSDEGARVKAFNDIKPADEIVLVPKIVAG